jgi:hypothetical protein
MTYDDLLDEFKSEAAIQRALGIKHRQTVNKWKEMDRIPTDHQITAEVVTRGKLKADLSDEQRRVIGRRQKAAA